MFGAQSVDGDPIGAVATMSEFDVNLISAFAKCPAFYDKSNPNFKDRAFTENAWKEISLQLGFDGKCVACKQSDVE